MKILGATRGEILVETFPIEIEVFKEDFKLYLKLMEDFLEGIKARLLASPSENLDEYWNSNYSGDQEHASYRENEIIAERERYFKTFPRILRYSIIVALYSFFEASIKKLAVLLNCTHNIKIDELERIFKKNAAIRYKENSKIGKSKNAVMCENIKIDDLRGSLIDKTRFYFNNALKIDISKDSLIWEHLVRFRELRNLIVHSNGKISKCNKKLMKYVKRKDNIKYFNCEDEYIFIKSNGYIDNNDYLTKSINSISDFLIELFYKIKEKLKANQTKRK